VMVYAAISNWCVNRAFVLVIQWSNTRKLIHFFRGKFPTKMKIVYLQHRHLKGTLEMMHFANQICFIRQKIS